MQSVAQISSTTLQCFYLVGKLIEPHIKLYTNSTSILKSNKVSLYSQVVWLGEGLYLQLVYQVAPVAHKVRTMKKDIK